MIRSGLARFAEEKVPPARASSPPGGPRHQNKRTLRWKWIYGMADLVCYCFKYTADDIRQDFEANGRSTILERIKKEKRSGSCQCADHNPKGR
jgi:hypothetical protein